MKTRVFTIANDACPADTAVFNKLRGNNLIRKTKKRKRKWGKD